jgi:putative acetyltransferase
MIRAYTAADAAPTLDIFERAISETALSRYSPDEVRAWLGHPRDPSEWHVDRARVDTYVAEIHGAVAGFTDLDADGYVDRLFVSPDHGRRGVGRALLAHVVEEAGTRGLAELTTHASLVARPVFERAGFSVVHEETIVKGAVSLRRFFMRR